MKKYIDLHCHPFKEYYENPDEIIENAFKSGVDKLFIVGTDLNNSKEVIKITSKHKKTYPIIGIHPNDCWNENIIDEFEKLIDDSIVGIGEIGLDFHYDDSPSKEMQKKCFIKQIEIARKNNLPIIVHSRDAHEETFNIIKKYKTKYPNMNFILHSYSSGPNYVDKYSKLGVYFSFSGIVTFKNAKDMQEAAKLVPLNLLFCETDSPYLTPTPFRGQINKPEYVIKIVEFIAKLKNVSDDVIIDNINKNIKKCFLKVK